MDVAESNDAHPTTTTPPDPRTEIDKILSATRTLNKQALESARSSVQASLEQTRRSFGEVEITLERMVTGDNVAFQATEKATQESMAAVQKNMVSAIRNIDQTLKAALETLYNADEAVGVTLAVDKTDSAETASLETVEADEDSKDNSSVKGANESDKA